MYTTIKPNAGSRINTTSLTPKSGLDLRTLPQLLSPENAITLKNYIISGDGGLKKRKGIKELFDASSATAITALEKWTDNLYLFGYASTKLAVYNISAGTVTDIKTNFNTTVTSIQRYGDYAFVASPGDKIGEVSFTLAYDAQSANFATGLVLTGGTSGATAIILEDADAGATGTLTLGNISGTFVTNETITDSATGSATSNGVVGYTYAAISAAPKARVIRVVDTRLFAGDLEDNRAAVKYCDVDDGTNPPFQTWTVGTGATQSGLLSYRNAGTVNLIENLGNVIIAGCEEGKWAFTIDTIDSAGTLSKVDNTVMYSLDSGMKAALHSDEGVFYVNAEGLWQLVSLGQSNIKFSDQESLISEKLGDEFFDNANFDDASIVKDDKTNQLLITYREDSSTNNQVLVYNTQMGAFGIFTGWNVREFMNDEGIIYAGGASTSKVWQIFKNEDDDGNDIWYEFEQELSVGQLWTKKELLGQYIQGELSPGTSPVIRFSIYDKDGNFIKDKLELQWSYGTSDLTARGYGELSWGDAVGGDIDSAGEVDNFAGSRARIKNFQRIRVNISGNDKEAHTINWLSLQTKEKLPIRRRNLTNITA